MHQVGLFVHRLRVFDDHARQELGTNTGQFNLRQFIDNFVSFHETDAIEGADRTSRLSDTTSNEEFSSGLIRYGTTGIASNIIDPRTNEVQLRRQKEFVEEIPLYFSFYTPDGEDTWYVVSQSYGTRSCSSAFNRSFLTFFTDRSEKSLTIQKVMPIDGSEMEYRNVQKITLVKRRVPSEAARNQVGNLAKELKTSLSISIDGRGSLGMFGNIRDYVEQQEDVALVFDGIEYEEMQATVKVGGSYRKVGIIGPNNNAGVVDVSDQIVRDDDDFPTFSSIDAVSDQICQEYLIAFRDQ